MSVRVIRTIPAMRGHIADVRDGEAVIGLVPTMGSLHAGHIRLIDHAIAECHHVVVTLFVNPHQFNQQGDYQRYPRSMERDLEICERQGAHVLFAPSVEEMYPSEQRSFVDVEHLTDHLCGKSRVGHFRGVATVVMKLFNIIQADRAYFGEKDAQQLAVIEGMVRDLNVPITIVPVPIVREKDGLAISSRNQHLGPGERKRARVLYRALCQAEKAIGNGARSAEAVRKQAVSLFEDCEGVRLEYLEIVDPENMQPVEEITGPVRVAMAAWVGKTRLIDNLLCRP